MKKYIVGLLLLAVMKMSAQEVPTFFPRKFLLEHFTSENCNQCPEGMLNIRTYLDKQTTPYIWVSHHAVYGTDEYTISESEQIAQEFSIYSVPTVLINRSQQKDILTLNAVNHLPDLEVLDDTLSEASVVIEHQFDSAKRKLHITVSGQVANASAEEYLLTILIKENRLVSKQADQTTSWKRANWLEYMHSRVVRDVLTATTGATVQVIDQKYSYSTNYTLNKHWNAENCCIVAYITPISKQPIINAEQVPLISGTSGGEEYEPYGITESKGPNASINFDSVEVSQVTRQLLEIKMYSNKTINSPYGGICKQVGILHLNTEAGKLQPGTYPIEESQALETITAGYRIDEHETFGGSRLIYALSEELKNGQIVPAHIWRINEGEMTMDEQGNITLHCSTYNGTNLTANAVYQTPTAVDNTLAPIPVKKIFYHGQLLIEKDGRWYNIHGQKQ